MSEVVKIVADTGGGFIDGVEYVPFEIHAKNDPSQKWYDNADIADDVESELIDLNRTPGYLTTSQPIKSQYIDKYKEVFKSGSDRIVVLPINRYFSGSYNEALAGADDINSEYGEEGKVLVADTLGISSKQMFQEEVAMKAAKEGMAAEEIKNVVENMHNDIFLAQVFSSLRHIKASGRAESAILDLLRDEDIELLERLNLNAVLGLNKETGEIEKIGARFGRLAMKHAFRHLQKKAEGAEVDMIVSHYDVDEEKIARFIDYGNKHLKIARIKKVLLPWVLRVHAGNDALGAGIKINR
jgi:DegV family protein with EDD domain